MFLTGTVPSITEILASSLSGMKEEIIDTIAAILPYACVVYGALCVVRLGIKIYKNITYFGSDRPDND